MKKVFFALIAIYMPLAANAIDINNIFLIGHIARNWSAIDSSYVEPSLYNFSVQVVEQNNQEQMSISSDDGTEIKLRSPWEPAAGVGLFWRWIGTNFTLNLRRSQLADGTKKQQFGLNIFSQLFNINLQYRKTGGDFRLKKMDLPGLGDITNPQGELAEYYASDHEGGYKDFNMGEDCSLKMFNVDVNYIWNHKKFSYPAAQSFSGCQLRSAGSLITGVALSHYDIYNDFSDWQMESSVLQMYAGKSGVSIFDVLHDIMNGTDKASAAETQQFFGRKLATSMSFTDVSFNVGYAYNWVPAPNFLVSGAFTLSPALKVCKGDNHKATLVELFDASKGADVDEIKSVIEDQIKESGIEIYNEYLSNPAAQETMNQLARQMSNGEAYNKMEYSYNKTIFDLNYSLRLAAVWTNSRWYAGANFTLQHYRYHNGIYTNFDNTFGTLNFTLGLRLGRKSEFRKNGEYGGRYRDPGIF